VRRFSNEGPSIENQPKRAVAAEVAGEGLLQHRERADGAEKLMQIVEPLVALGIEGQQMCDVAIGETLQDVFGLAETVARLA
jgi:hypothetical protein